MLPFSNRSHPNYLKVLRQRNRQRKGFLALMFSKLSPWMNQFKNHILLSSSRILQRQVRLSMSRRAQLWLASGNRLRTTHPVAIWLAWTSMSSSMSSSHRSSIGLANDPEGDGVVDDDEPWVPLKIWFSTSKWHIQTHLWLLIENGPSKLSS